MTPRETMLDEAKTVDQALLSGPWTADIDDPETTNDGFTGKFVNAEGRSTCLYDDADVARHVARMRNVLPKLIARIADLERHASAIRYLGNAGHFVSADRCLFHLHTDVGITNLRPRGLYCVSTVGEYLEKPSDTEFTHLGGLGPNEKAEDLLYEVMVFEIDVDGETNGQSIDSERCGTRERANVMHEEYVDRWARKALGDP